MALAPNVRDRALTLMQDTAMSDRAIGRAVGVGNKTISRWRRDSGITATELVDAGIGPAELTVALAAHGISFSRFRAWRRAGLLPVPRRSWQHAGSRALHDPAVVEQAVRVARAVARHRSIDLAALALFADGHPVCQRTIRRVYVAHMERIDRDLRRINGILTDTAATTDAAFDLLHNFAARSSRMAGARRAVRDQGATAGSRVGDAVIDYLQDSTTTLLGLPGGLGRGHARIQATMPRPLTAEEIAAVPQVFAAISVPAILDAARHATIAELDEACAEIRLAAVVIKSVVIDMPIRMVGEDPANHPMPAFDDAALHARLALVLAAAKRHPETGKALTAWTRSLYEGHTARDVLAALHAALPRLQRELLGPPA